MTDTTDDLALAQRFLSGWLAQLADSAKTDPGLVPFVSALRAASDQNTPGRYANTVTDRPDLAIFEPFEQTLDAIELPGIDSALIRDLARRVHWYELYKGDSVDETLASSMSAAHIVGPKGLIHSATCVAGMFLLAPDLYYPKHEHEAEEFYQVISGTVAITHGVTEAATDYARGTICRQPPNVVHDLTVGPAAALILYAWIGNLDCPVWMWREEHDSWWRDRWERSDGQFRITESQPVAP